MFGVWEVGNERSHHLGLAEQPHGDLGDDAQRAFRADHERAQVRAHGVQRVAAEGDDAAIGADKGEREHVVGGESVLEAMRSTGVLRDVPADGADDLARRVRREVEVVLRHGGRDAGVGDTGLYDRALVLDIDGEELTHPLQADHDAVGHGQGAAGQPSAGSAGDERDSLPGTHPHDGGDLFGRLRQYHQRRHNPETGQAVAFVGVQLGWCGNQSTLADEAPDLAPHLVGDSSGRLLGDQFQVG